MPQYHRGEPTTVYTYSITDLSENDVWYLRYVLVTHPPSSLDSGHPGRGSTLNHEDLVRVHQGAWRPA